MKTRILGCLFLLWCGLAYANPGPLFAIAESGDSASVDISLCLNGNALLSCQNYHVLAQNLTITTTAAHYYPSVGIKVLTPGYQPTSCTSVSNGYCLFAADNITGATISLNPSSGGAPTISQISPIGGSIAGGTTVTIEGTYLTGTASITFGGTVGSSITVINDSTVTVVTPAHSLGTVDVVLTAAGGSVTASNSYTYGPVLFTGTTNGGTSSIILTGESLDTIWAGVTPAVYVSSTGQSSCSNATYSEHININLVYGNNGQTDTGWVPDNLITEEFYTTCLKLCTALTHAECTNGILIN